MERYENLVELFEKSVAEHHERPLFGTKRAGRWHWLSYGEVANRVAALRAGMHELGVERGDRVAIVAKNSVEWAVVAFATFGLGATIVPMYPEQRPSEWRFILEDSGARIVFAGTRAIADALRSAEVPDLERVITIEAAEGEGYHALLGAGAPWPSAQPGSDDIACLIYTSGTTGRPKGVLLSHGNITSNINAIRPLFPFTPNDRSLSFLPWAHAFGLTCELFGLMSMGCSTAINDEIGALVANLTEASPTVLVAVPRIFNRIYQRIESQVARKPRAVQRLYRAGVAAGAKKQRGERLRARERLALGMADALVFRAIRDKLGGKLAYAVSGSAALEIQVAELIDALGITVYEGYGLTETSPIVSVNAPSMRKLGSVGKPLEGVTVTIDERRSERAGEGEVIVSGPNVMKGYHDRPDQQAEVVEPDGSFRTGDLGRFDEEGFLFITGRLKEQYKLENGKYVMPTAVEEQLKLSPYVANALVTGANRAYNVALVVPNKEAIARWAEEKHLTIDRLEESSEVEELLWQEVEKHSAALRSYERPRDIAIVAEDFTTDNGLATPTMKLRRSRILERYGDRITRLYEHARAAE